MMEFLYIADENYIKNLSVEKYNKPDRLEKLSSTSGEIQL
jgi:hypothetical protein